MNILLTGSTGYVGRHLIMKLIKLGYNILEITIEPEESKKLFGNKTNKFFYSNITKQDLFKKVSIFNPDIVIHLAAFLTSSDEYDYMEKLIDTNIKFTCNILDSLKETKLKLFINTGTFAEYYKGDSELDPAYLYSATKSASRIFVDYYSKRYNFNHITIVPYTIYGGIDTQKKTIDIIYDALVSQIPLDLTLGNQILDFIHIDDVIQFYMKIIENFERIHNDTCFQLGTGMGHTLRELAYIMEKKTGKKANINWGGEKYRPRDIMYAVANYSTQYNLFGWRPKISLERGIEIYLAKKVGSKYDFKT
ncbi:NAD(P)-dependent oxidoreductase [bacterium]|nr:MAG: NAD(P)-dependent oxidoreductase [bacterium]